MKGANKLVRSPNNGLVLLKSISLMPTTSEFSVSDTKITGYNWLYKNNWL